MSKKEGEKMKLKVLKLGTECRDKATGLCGTLTHWTLGMGERIDYLFQPRGLNEEGQPVKRLFLPIERLEIEGDQFEEVDVPFEILGTTVTDKASGFTGMAIEFVRHINGCFHVVIQPEGLLPGKNMPVRANDFDLRGCEGEMITQLSEEALKKSKAERPSPTGGTFIRGREMGESSRTPSRFHERE